MTKVSRLTRFFLPFLVILAALAAVRWAGARMTSAGNLLGDDNLSLIGGTAYLFLLGGISGLQTAFRQRRREPARALSPWLVLLLAFCVPLLISWLPDLITLTTTWTSQGFIPTGLFSGWHPWLPIQQAVALIILLLAGGEMRLAPPTTLDARQLATAAMWGMGLWLVLTFSAHLASLVSPIPSMHGLADSLFFAGCMAAAGLVLLPIGEEILFRGHLLGQWQARFGPTAGSLLCAAIFALANMRPVLWLPAFLVGIGLNWLANRNQGLQLPILAHAVLNVFALLILPAALI